MTPEPLFHSRMAVVVLAALAVLGEGTRGMAATLISDDFSGGIDDWSTLGTVFDTGESAVFSDQVSDRAAIFQSKPILDKAVLTFEFDFLNGLSPSVPAGGLPDSYFGTVYTGVTSFGEDLDNGVFDAAVSLLDLDANGAVTSTGTITDSTAKGAGWLFYSGSFEVPAGNTTLAFEFFNDNGLSGDSSVAVDNVLVSFEVVPEPSAGLLLALSLFATMRSRRRSP